MSNINIYGGLETPYWQQIDKIHYGPAATLDPNDEIMLGRYVLVKYITDLVLSQDTKIKLIDGTLDKENTILAYNTWKNCYRADQNNSVPQFQDYDGVVFKKIYSETEGLKYIPIAQLSTSISVNNMVTKDYLEDNYLTANEVLTEDTANTKYVTIERLDELEAIETFFSNEVVQDDTINTLIEIQKQFNQGITAYQDLSNRINDNASNIETNIKNIQTINTTLGSMAEMIIVDIDTVAPNEERMLDGWLESNNPNLLLNTLYIKNIYTNTSTELITKDSTITDGAFYISLDGDVEGIWYSVRSKVLQSDWQNNLLSDYPVIPQFTNSYGEILPEAFPLFYGTVKQNTQEKGTAILAFTYDLKGISLYTKIDQIDSKQAVWQGQYTTLGKDLTTSTIDLQAMFPLYNFEWKPYQFSISEETFYTTFGYINGRNYSTTIQHQNKIAQDIRYLVDVDGEQRTWKFVGKTGVTPQWEIF